MTKKDTPSELEIKRLKALASLNLLDTPSEDEFDRITRLASLICETPISLISLVDSSRQWFKSKVGIDAEETPREIAFCNHAIQGKELFEVNNASEDERFKENILVTEDPHIKFYTGQPLILPNGLALGTLCVIDKIPRKLNQNQKDSLKLLADEVISLIVSRKEREDFKNFGKLFILSKDIICITDSEGVLKKINPAFEDLLGWSQKDLLQQSFYNFIHKEDVNNTKNEIKKLIKQNDTVDFTHKFKTKDNNYRTLQWTASFEPTTGDIFATARDITEQVNKTELLAISEKRFKNFFEQSQGLMCTHDLKGKLLSVNQSGSAALGYSYQEVLNLSLYDIVPEKRHADVDNYLEHVQQTGSFKGKMQTLGKNGMKHIWLFSNTLEKNHLGEPYIIGNAIDISEQHLLEKKLNRVKTILEQTNEVSRVGGWQVDLVKNRVHWTDMTKIIHGVPLDYEPNIETGINFYKEGIHRDTIATAVNKAIEKGIGWDLEAQIINIKKEAIWVRAIGQPKFENNICTKIFGTFQDINERKIAQIKFKESKLFLDSVLDSSSEISIIATNLDGIVTVFNKGAENILGYSATEIINKQTPAIFHDFDEIRERADELSQLFGKEIKGFNVFTEIPEIKGSEQREWSYIKKNGNKITVSIVVTPIKDKNNKTNGYLGIATNITKRKIFEKELLEERKALKNATKRAEEANVAKSEFLANMSHEIRTPLNGIIGFTDLALQTDLSNTQKQYLNIVDQSANGLLSIINDILDFSKIEAGKLELDIEKCSIAEIGAYSSNIINFQAQEKNLELLLNIDHELPKYIWADSIRLKQVLINLLGNAVKFTEKGEIELKIETKTSKNFKKTIRFSVRDTGIGIQKEKQKKIFKAFSQEDTSTTKKYGGTGLGLTISNKLLKMMNSKLELESTLGIGSTFYFDVDFKTKEGTTNWINLEKINHALIIDDNENNRKIVKEILIAKNITSDLAKSGFEALQLLSENNEYDLIITDYQMPYMDGIETITKIRENFYKPESPKQPIILLSSSSTLTEEKEQEIYSLGVVDNLTKPIKAEQLFEMISKSNTEKEIKPIKVEAQYSDKTTPIKILLVEDNHINSLLTQTLLKKEFSNIDITEAINGKISVDLFKENTYDIVLMDIQMPIMNGYEATKKIREFESDTHTPIIAVTAANVKGEREKCIEIGMDDFLAKPIVKKELISTIKKWIELKKENTPEETTDQHYNEEQLKLYYDNDIALINEIKKMVVEQLEENFEQIKTVILEKDLVNIKKIGHKLYGTASTAGLEILAILSKELELITEYEEIETKNIWTRIEQEIPTVINLLKN